jgi:hypothetical protein
VEALTTLFTDHVVPTFTCKKRVQVINQKIGATKIRENRALCRKICSQKIAEQRKIFFSFCGRE